MTAEEHMGSKFWHTLKNSS